MSHQHTLKNMKGRGMGFFHFDERLGHERVKHYYYTNANHGGWLCLVAFNIKRMRNHSHWRQTRLFNYI